VFKILRIDFFLPGEDPSYFPQKRHLENPFNPKGNRVEIAVLELATGVRRRIDTVDARRKGAYCWIKTDAWGK